MVMNQGEVGVGDFVLMDKIDIDNFMRNLELRLVRLGRDTSRCCHDILPGILLS